jgi:hypothetical protein
MPVFAVSVFGGDAFSGFAAALCEALAGALPDVVLVVVPDILLAGTFINKDLASPAICGAVVFCAIGFALVFFLAIRVLFHFAAWLRLLGLSALNF